MTERRPTRRPADRRGSTGLSTGRRSMGSQSTSMHRQSTLLVTIVAISVAALACGKSSPTTPSTPPPTAIGPINHVFVVVEENEGADAVIGNPQMPYFNGLAT